jgi:hypothetical protein
MTRDEKIAALRKMASEFMSSTEAAVKLGMTRNAVMGIAFRNGFNFKSIQIAKKRDLSAPKPKPSEPRVAVKVSKHVSVPVRVDPPIKQEYRQTEGVLIADLRSAMCKYVLGYPCLDQTRFCGQVTGDLTKPYCPHHHALCYIPYVRRKRIRVSDVTVKKTSTKILEMDDLHL